MNTEKHHEQTPLLSICSLVYNHENFLRKCLDGFAMQKTNFPIEVVIHDDASTDKSADIIREYVERYPHIQWRPFYQVENQMSQGKRFSLHTFSKVRGKYVALCEGDDYWTDPLKLQKQVDFLEANPDFSTCFHPVRVTWEDGAHSDSFFPSSRCRYHKDVLTLEDLSHQNFIQTNSVVYRWRFNRCDFKFEEQFPIAIIPGDYMLHLFHAQTGKIKCLDNCMAVYRRHAGGVWVEAGKSDAFYIKNGLGHLNFYRQAERITKLDFSRDRQALLLDCVLASMTMGRGDILEVLKSTYPEDFEIVTQPYTKAARVSKRLSKFKRTRRAIKCFAKEKASSCFKKLFGSSSRGSDEV